MPATSNQRAKLLYLMKILLDKSDAANPLTMNDLIAALAAYGIQAERKSIYSDLEILRQFGLDIETQRSKATSYYIANRQFELPELKLLVDAVQSSRFITEKKSNELIAKLSSLTNEAQAKQLRRQVYVAGCAKSFNEMSYYSVDAIHTAINDRKKIAFKYFDYDVKKKRVYRKEAATYIVTHITLCWDNDNYYLIAYSVDFDDLRHYRVDRMSDTETLNDPADSFDKKKFNVADHIKRIFGMYSGELVHATLSFDNSLINVVLDYFGKDIVLKARDNGWIEVKADVSVSPVFLAWMFQFGDHAQIKAPQSLITAMRESLLANAYKYLPLSE